jgi:hypothetical protein
VDIVNDNGKVVAKVTAADPNTMRLELHADDDMRPTLHLVRYKRRWMVSRCVLGRRPFKRH